jgi:hypothetical protein
VTVNVTNPLSDVIVKFCAQVNVLPEPAQSEYDPAVIMPSCMITPANLKLTLNTATLTRSQPIVFGRGITNTFRVEFSTCEDEGIKSGLATVWTMNEVSVWRGETPIDEHCYMPRPGSLLTIEPNTLNFGTNFSLKAYAFEKDYPENYAMLGSFTIVVGASPLITSLNSGVAMVEVEANKNLEISFVQSTYDPDMSDKANKQGMEFYLFCVPSKEDADLASIADKIHTHSYNLAAFNLTTVLTYEHANREYKIQFRQRSCLNDPNSSVVHFRPEAGTIEVNSTELKLNETMSLCMQLFVVKASRVSQSQRLYVNIDLQSVLSISVDTDLHEMGKALDVLTDLARQNPQKALTYVNSFADVINTKSDTANTVILLFKVFIYEKKSLNFSFSTSQTSS